MPVFIAKSYSCGEHEQPTSRYLRTKIPKNCYGPVIGPQSPVTTKMIILTEKLKVHYNSTDLLQNTTLIRRREVCQSKFCICSKAGHHISTIGAAGSGQWTIFSYMGWNGTATCFRKIFVIKSNILGSLPHTKTTFIQ